VAYGDHETDFPLLKIAQRGIVVNPDAKLTVKAKENQLELVDWE
jgi:phosphoserine phosphatase